MTWHLRNEGCLVNEMRVWPLKRSLKYECVYLHVWETGSEANADVKKWIEFHNRKRPHSALGGKLPTVVYGPVAVWCRSFGRLSREFGPVIKVDRHLRKAIQ